MTPLLSAEMITAPLDTAVTSPPGAACTVAIAGLLLRYVVPVLRPVKSAIAPLTKLPITVTWTVWPGAVRFVVGVEMPMRRGIGTKLPSVIGPDGTDRPLCGRKNADWPR